MLSLTELITSPILSQIDLSLMDYLQRKLSPDIFQSHMHNDIRILEILEGLGVVFLVPHTVLIKSLYSVLSCMEQFKEDKELEKIQNLLVNGIVQQAPSFPSWSPSELQELYSVAALGGARHETF